jgi:hypothetical protein
VSTHVTALPDLGARGSAEHLIIMKVTEMKHA